MAGISRAGTDAPGEDMTARLDARRRLDELLARMRSDNARFRVVSGGSEAVSAITVDEWADELAALLAAGAAGREEDLHETIEKCARIAEMMAVGPWGDAHDALAPASLAKMIARAIRDSAKAFPVYQCEEWQCRHVCPSGLCCTLPKDHASDHECCPSLLADGAAGREEQTDYLAAPRSPQRQEPTE